MRSVKIDKSLFSEEKQVLEEMVLLLLMTLLGGLRNIINLN